MRKSYLTLCLVLGLAAPGGASGASKTLPIGPAERADFAAGLADGMRVWPDARAIEKFYPADFKRMVDAAVEASLAKGSIDQVSPQKLAADIVPAFTAVRDEVIDREYPKANNQNVRAIMQLGLDRARAGLAQSPRACMLAIGMAKELPRGPRELIVDPYLQRMGQITADIIEQTATHPSLPPDAPDPEALNALNLEAAKALPSEESLDHFLAAAELPAARWNDDQQRATCLFYVLRLEVLLARPNDEGVRLYWALRYGGPSAPWAGRQSR
ncbi:hypothetical protein [Phenylobacterium sp.]|uniref:hypothetical protein n=1 Tax=Phenylobacterium sp. TaxID=1871053 RepID=UPI003BABEB3D